MHVWGERVDGTAGQMHDDGELGQPMHGVGGCACMYALAMLHANGGGGAGCAGSSNAYGEMHRGYVAAMLCGLLDAANVMRSCAAMSCVMLPHGACYAMCKCGGNAMSCRRQSRSSRAYANVDGRVTRCMHVGLMLWVRRYACNTARVNACHGLC